MDVKCFELTSHYHQALRLSSLLRSSRFGCGQAKRGCAMSSAKSVDVFFSIFIDVAPYLDKLRDHRAENSRVSHEEREAVEVHLF